MENFSMPVEKYEFSTGFVMPDSIGMAGAESPLGLDIYRSHIMLVNASSLGGWQFTS